MGTVFLTTLAFAEIVILGRIICQIVECFLSGVRHRLLNVILWPIMGIAATTPIQKVYLTNIWVVLLLFSLVVFIGYQGKLLVKTSVVFLLSPIIIALGLFSDFLDQGQSYFFAVFFFVLILFWWALGTLVKNKIPAVRLYFTNTVMLLADCICIAPLVAVVFVASTTHDQVIPTLAISFSCVVTGIGVLLLMVYLGESAKSRLETESYQLKHDYYTELDNHQTEVLKLQHDMKHHIQLMEDLVADGKVEQAAAYIDKVKTTYIQKHPTIRFCNHTLVNSLLASKYRRMRELSINADIQVSLEEGLMIDDVDFCSLFANTIDNAIEACEQIENMSDRRISIKARVHNGFFSYQISNSIRPNSLVKNSDGSLKTTKRNLLHHGHGLQNVKDFVKKYNGNLDITLQSDTFELTIILPVV